MRLSKNSENKIIEAENAGYQIIYGNNPFLNKHKKWAKYKCIRLVQTNSRAHGRPIYTVWAVKLEIKNGECDLDAGIPHTTCF